MSSLRIALRSLLKSPSFTIVSLLTLALGIGVNTSMFSLVDALLFRAAPYAEPQELALLTSHTRNGEARSFSVEEIREIREQSPGFSSLATVGHTFFAMAEPGQPAERIHALTVSAEGLDVFRIRPMLGRMFTAEECGDGRNQVVVLTESFWRSRFGGDPDIIDRTLRLDGQTVTVIGVMPTSSEYRMFWGNIALWRPLNFTNDQVLYRAYRAFFLVGRLAPGSTPASIGAQLAPYAASVEKAHPRDYPGLRFSTLTLNEAAMDDTGRGISWMLLGLSGFVLLIGCANLANLQLARTTASLKDFAIRAALGASRARLIAHQLLESVVLAVAGGLLGVLVAQWLNSALERSISIDGASGAFQMHLDTRVLLLTLAVASATGVLFGIVPAVLASRTSVVGALKQQSRGSTSGRGAHRMRHALIIAEVALALVLLGGAAIMNRGFSRMLDRQVGWQPDTTLIASITIPETRYDSNLKRLDFFRRLEARLATIPGAEQVALSTSLPLFNYSSERQVFTESTGSGQGANPLAYHVMITPDYFATLGIRLLEGRTFAADIDFDDPAQIVVNRSLARQFWPGESAVGKRLGGVENTNTVWYEVIGVVDDVEPVANFAHPPTSLHVYRPLVQEPWSFVNVAVRSERPAALIETVRRAVAEVDADLATEGIGTVDQFVNRVQHNFIVVGRVLIGFAGLGLVLAAVGLYGVISNLVAQRTSEFGIRIALGAQPRDVMVDVLRRGMILAGLGLALGVVGAALLGRFLSGIMPRLAAADPAGIAGVAGVLLLVSLVACWFPAHRATRVDPLTALRSE